jgi:hypothetical protein
MDDIDGPDRLDVELASESSNVDGAMDSFDIGGESAVIGRDWLVRGGFHFLSSHTAPVCPGHLNSSCAWTRFES